jgi:hypothetical protein
MKDLRQLALTGEEVKETPVKPAYHDDYDDWGSREYKSKWDGDDYYDHKYKYEVDDSTYGMPEKKKIKRSNNSVKLQFVYKNDEIGPFADYSEVTYSYTKMLEKVEDMAIEDLKKINKSVEQDFAIVMDVKDDYDQCTVTTELVRLDLTT